MACALMVAATAVVPAAVAEPLGDGLKGRTPAFVLGYGNRGGLGVGSTANADQPVPVALPADAVSVAGGVGFSVALTRSGRVYAWGDGRWGQLGNGSTRSSLSVPVQVKVSRHVIAVDAADHHAVALTADGRVYGWGQNDRGQLGDGTTTDRSTPVAAATVSLSRITAVAAGSDHTLAVTSSGGLQGWGAASDGQLGVTGPDRRRPVTVPLPGSARAAAASAGAGHSVVLTTRGQVVVFGHEHGTAAAPRSARIIQVPGDHVTVVAAGIGHTYALTSSGQLYAWGDNSRGQLGDGSTTDRATPRAVTGLSKIRSLAAGGYHALAVDSSGRLWTWGDNTYGQSGAASAEGTSTPRRLTALDGARGMVVGAADHHTMIIVASGPLAALTMSPSRTTVRPGQQQTYRVSGVDVFGTQLADLTGRATLSIADGQCHTNRCSASAPGVHLVIARFGERSASAQLVVTRAGPKPTPRPSPHTRSPSPTPTSSDHAGSGENHGGTSTGTDHPTATAGGLASTGAGPGLWLAAAVGLAAVIAGTAVLCRRRHLLLHTRPSTKGR